MDTIQSASSSSEIREFYVPATFQFSTKPGRIERAVTYLFSQRGAMDGQPRTHGSTAARTTVTASGIPDLGHGKRPGPQ